MQVFSRDDRWRNHFSFSHLYTGLSYSGICDFIGLRSDSWEETDPVPGERRTELGDLFLWMYGSKKRELPPVVETQNPHLRQLESVLSSRESVAALRANNDLASAFEQSRPSSTVFEESLFAAKRNLQRARGMLSTGYDGSERLLSVADAVADLANDLYEEMLRKGHRRRRRRVCSICRVALGRPDDAGSDRPHSGAKVRDRADPAMALCGLLAAHPLV